MRRQARGHRGREAREKKLTAVAAALCALQGAERARSEGAQQLSMQTISRRMAEPVDDQPRRRCRQTINRQTINRQTISVRMRSQQTISLQTNSVRMRSACRIPS